MGEEQLIGLKCTEQPTTMDGLNTSELGTLHFILLVNVTEARIGMYHAMWTLDNNILYLSNILIFVKY